MADRQWDDVVVGASDGRGWVLVRTAVIVLIVVCLGLGIGGGLLREASGPTTPSLGILPGEFERHDAIMLAWDSDLTFRQRQALRGIAAAVARNTRIIVLVPDAATRASATRQLTEAGISRGRFAALIVPLTTPWARDFGPLVVKGSDGEPLIIDPLFRDEVENDAVPSEFARIADMRVVHADFSVEGGNFLSNGAGLGIATERLPEENRIVHGLSKAEVGELLLMHFGCREVVYLEPLEGERTGHVDMFATFTAADTVVVGSYAPAVDPVNAAILDRNAARLAEVVTAAGPLIVYRVPMPRRFEGQWPSYTNVVYANGTLLVPSFDSADPDEEARALDVYRELLPGWRIVTLDGTDLITDNGALHCATNNIHRLPPAFLRQLEAAHAPPHAGEEPDRGVLK